MSYKFDIVGMHIHIFNLLLNIWLMFTTIRKTQSNKYNFFFFNYVQDHGILYFGDT